MDSSWVRKLDCMSGVFMVIGERYTRIVPRILPKDICPMQKAMRTKENKEIDA